MRVIINPSFSCSRDLGTLSCALSRISSTTFMSISIRTNFCPIFFSIWTLIMNPNSFRFRLITLDEVSMPVGNGQIVGLQRLWFNDNALNGLLCTVFGKQPASRFQIFRFNPFAARIKRVDAVGNEGLYFTEAV